MIERGLYIIKKEFFELVNKLGGDCDLFTGNKRPVYCCIKDANNPGLFWAIPTSDLSHRSEVQIAKYDLFLSLPEDDLRSCYYHKAKTTKEALYKISSCYPITDKYIDYQFTTHGVHVVMKRKESILRIEGKLKRILEHEEQINNYFPQRITDIKKYLLSELAQIDAQQEVAQTDESKQLDKMLLFE